MDPKGKPYNRLDIGTELSEIMDPKDILCLGPLNRNVEWYLTVSTETVKNQLLQSNGILLYNKFWGHFSPASNTEVKLRIHWLPPWVENYKISQAFEKEGLEVKHIAVDRSSVKLPNGKTLQNSYITARTVIIKIKQNQNVPYLLPIFDQNFNESYQALVTMPGRKGLCLRCKTPGHYSAACTTDYCTKCSSFGHKALDCARLFSAAVRKGTVNREEDLSDMDEGAVAAAEAPNPSRSSDDRLATPSTQTPMPSVPGQTTTQGENMTHEAAPILAPVGNSGESTHTVAAPEPTPPLTPFAKTASEAERLSEAGEGPPPAGQGRGPTAGVPPHPRRVLTPHSRLVAAGVF